MPRPFLRLRSATIVQNPPVGSVLVGPVVIVGSVLVGLPADDVVVAIEMDLDLAAVLAGNLDLEGAGAIAGISLDLGDGPATHRHDRGALGLLGFGTRDLLLGVAAVGVGDPSSAEGQQYRHRRGYHQRPYVYSLCVYFIASFLFDWLWDAV